MKITDNNIKRVLECPSNVFFTNSASEKYSKFKDIDPFPDISDSLLNGNDVTKYVLATGLLEPFDPQQLSGVTYTANFSGALYYWSPEGKQVYCTVGDGEDHILPPNSITYLEIDTYFRVPNYMALRFNLRVKNVYKGLLLGTGPIIDSGFVGRIFVPLHNLTTNSYIIRKGAKLIEIEFTKISKSIETSISNELKLETGLKGWDFSDIPRIVNDIPEARKYDEYLHGALTDEKSGFFVEGKQIFICSANSELDKRITESQSELNSAINDLTKQGEKINETFDKAERRENFIKSFSILSLIAMLLTAITLGITAYSYFSQSTELKLAHQSVEQSIEYNEQRIREILLIIEALDVSANIPDELSEQYHIMLEEIESEIKELQKQQQDIFKSNIIGAVVLAVLTLLTIGVIIYFAFYVHNKLKILEKNIKTKSRKTVKSKKSLKASVSESANLSQEK